MKQGHKVERGEQPGAQSVYVSEQNLVIICRKRIPDDVVYIDVVFFAAGSQSQNLVGISSLIVVLADQMMFSSTEMEDRLADEISFLEVLDKMHITRTAIYGQGPRFFESAELHASFSYTNALRRTGIQEPSKTNFD